MKMTFTNASFERIRRPGQRGSAVIVVIALIAILLIYMAGNIRTLSALGRDLRVVEQKQTQRLARTNVRTNLIQAVQSDTPGGDVSYALSGLPLRNPGRASGVAGQ